MSQTTRGHDRWEQWQIDDHGLLSKCKEKTKCVKIVSIFKEKWRRHNPKLVSSTWKEFRLFRQLLHLPPDNVFETSWHFPNNCEFHLLWTPWMSSHGHVLQVSLAIDWSSRSQTTWTLIFRRMLKIYCWNKCDGRRFPTMKIN